ncbi:hypothetical protein M3Y99_01999700 [Aphelenchoides fujianensis]|nr:hypothetical protein M3Y99_01999700 [Aphelenchoides fujianensis]
MSSNPNAAILHTLSVSAMSTGLSATLLQPLDRLKTLRQQLNHRSQSSWHLMLSVIRANGALDLWKGLTPTLMRVVPGATIYLSGVNLLRAALKVDDQNGTGLFLTGFGTRTLAATLMHPTTVLKTRLESSIFNHSSVADAFRNVVRETGVRGLWRGLVPTILRDSPFSGLYLVFYRRQIAFVEKQAGDCNPLVRFGAGLTSGFLACLFTQPFDVLKTVVQLYPKEFSSSTLRSSFDLYKTGSFRIFFVGYWLRATKRTLTAALNWTIFDELFKRHGSLSGHP